MSKPTKIELLYGLLADERRRVVSIVADSGVLPPSGMLAYLADLDGATLAVEAVLEERTMLEAAPPLSGAMN